MYNDFLVDNMLAVRTTTNKERSQAHDDDSTAPLHGPSSQEQGPGKSS